jgi:uncharacterized protein (DUF362 family)
MMRITRREFIRLLAAGAGTAAAAPLLNACAGTPTPLPPTATSTYTPFPPSGTAAATDTPAPAAGADLAVARGGDDPELLVRRAVDALGGMGRFVPQGANVILKPNICTRPHSFEDAATTNPFVVAALVKMCREAGASRVRVFDFPFGSSWEEAYAGSGIQDAVLAAGGEMEPLAFMKFVATQIPGAQSLREPAIYDEVMQADVLINVPIAKDHGLARVTMGMKNLLGVVQDRPSCHRGMPQKLADLAGFLRPELTIVDAVRILLRNGPTGGNPNDVKKLDTVIASADFVAADAYGATLFGLNGYDDLPYIAAAADAGLGTADLSKLKIEEIPVGA